MAVSCTQPVTFQFSNPHVPTSTHLHYRNTTIPCLIFSLFIIFFSLHAIAEAATSTPATQRPYVIKGKKYYPIPNSDGFKQRGTASWYGKDFHGRMTSNGETYDMYDMTAAHKTLPMDTMLLVKNTENNKKLVVRVNDRGPFVNGRIIDLSYKAANQLGVIGNGTAKVEILALAEGKDNKLGGAPILVYTDMSVGEFYVQIGAFAQKINAIKLQKRFTDAGHTTIIQKYFGPDKVLYRVQVYAGKTLKNAQEAETALHEHGYVGSFIIAR